ncbi:hypothetical protein CLU97_0136 [Chryseobacterium sp. 7]|uniref:hypothetical protein n=1 Tax=Chryseobacterium sp. 7 TaxID=2035214 RepID=UPI000EB40D68|nr:hypothetical protein [Chryseobacterium sp. 7]RLJ30744.1 hypothetical protein CLU97_0136 [Chryseobacterium sp. 7]
MNAKNLLSATLLLISALYSSQTGGVGINTTSPQGALDVVSKTGTFIPPRMTTTERDALVAPPTGAVVYNTTTPGLEFNFGTPAAPNWKTAVTTVGTSSNIVLAGGSSDATPPTVGSNTVGDGYYQFSINLPSSAKCKLDLYPTVWSDVNKGVGTDLYIDGTKKASVVTAVTSPVNLHVVVPYSYVTPTALTAGSHTIKIQAYANPYPASATAGPTDVRGKIDNFDRITYSYLCWN